MNSAAVKSAFAAHGVKVRVRDLGNRFIVCPAKRGERDEGFPHYLVALIANVHGFTDVCGRSIGWSAFNGYRELTAYKPGAIVRITRR